MSKFEKNIILSYFFFYFIRTRRIILHAKTSIIYFKKLLYNLKQL